MADQSKRVEFRSGNREGFILLPPEGKLVVRDRSTDVDGVTITKDAILGPDGTPIGGDPGEWIPMELNQGYRAQSDNWFYPSYRRVGDRVELQGNLSIVQLPQPPADAVFTTLPEGYRPETDLTVMIGDELNGEMTGFDITTSGQCRIVRRQFWDINDESSLLSEHGFLILCLTGISFSVSPENRPT